MLITTHYDSPLGALLLAADGEGLSGICFENGGHTAAALGAARREGSLPVLEEARRWLDVYFTGREPDFMPALRPLGTPFQAAVWALLRRIPYGACVSYGALARELAAQRGLARMSAQAVGGAVGRNPIPILIPCHRVVGSGGALVGYAAGLERKSALLRLEGADPSALARPAREKEREHYDV